MTSGKGRVLALDLGTRRIGVAVSDELRLTARPLATIESIGPRRDAQALRMLVADLRLDVLVVGLPLLDSGEEGGSAQRARQVGEDLGRRLQLPVVFVDEGGTTLEAAAALRSEGVRKSKLAAQLDGRAAVLILEAYLAEDARGA
jgi:putative Holliday junction resolvase